MSEENVETVRRFWRANEDRGLGVLPEFFDEQVIWQAIEGAPDDVGEMRGVAALRRYVEDWLGTFADVTAVPIQVLDLDDDRVLAVVRLKGRARLSGVETELSYAIVYTLSDGKIVRGHEYVDRAAALEAAGRERAPVRDRRALGQAEQADLIVTMGCGDECPCIPGKRYLDWELPDPKGRPLDEVRATRNEIDRRVELLVAELS